MSSKEQTSRVRRPIWRVVLIVTLVTGGIATQRLWPKKPLAVRVSKAAVGSVRDVVSSSTAGEVMPQIQATVRADLGGQVVAVHFERGARVRKHDLVVALDPADLNARLQQAHAAVASAEAQRLQAMARLTTLRRQAQRAQVLTERGAGTAQVSEDALSAVQEATQAVHAATSQHASAQAALEVAKVARMHADIRAPFDGVLTDVPVHLGESLPPSSPVLHIIDDGRLHVDASLDEADAARVKEGQSASLHLDALPDRNIAGRVTRVDPVVKRDLKGARTLTVEVEVEGLPQARALGLRPGMSANVEILVAEKRDVLAIPSNAIVGRGVNRFVYVLEPEGRFFRAKHMNVAVGISNWERTEISSGLSAGALVVLSLNEKGFEEGKLVTPIEQAGASEAKPTP